MKKTYRCGLEKSEIALKTVYKYSMIGDSYQGKEQSLDRNTDTNARFRRFLLGIKTPMVGMLETMCVICWKMSLFYNVLRFCIRLGLKVMEKFIWQRKFQSTPIFRLWHGYFWLLFNHTYHENQGQIDVKTSRAQEYKTIKLPLRRNT